MAWPRPKAGTGNAKILSYLETHREITTTQIYDFDMSKNPSQRYTELTERFGCHMSKEDLRSDTGKAYSRWRFYGFKDLDGQSSSPLGAVRTGAEPVATLDTSRQVTGSAEGDTKLSADSLPQATPSDSATNRAVSQQTAGGCSGQHGRDVEARPAPTLFELDDLPTSHYMSEAA